MRESLMSPSCSDKQTVPVHSEGMFILYENPNTTKGDQASMNFGVVRYVVSAQSVL